MRRIVHRIHVIDDVVVEPESRPKPTFNKVAHRIVCISYPAIQLAKLRFGKGEVVVRFSLVRADGAFAQVRFSCLSFTSAFLQCEIPKMDVLPSSDLLPVRSRNKQTKMRNIRGCDNNGIAVVDQ